VASGINDIIVQTINDAWQGATHFMKSKENIDVDEATEVAVKNPG
jgi:hypothetical protein